ncbi:abortive infection system antitoxin AbiGi family protein [Streptosporangium sp. NPDC005286]|uniref:abortive infection system antitoxin AbiGi family protein n=1 Tax=Streptosporangium sp. NPDC005286 TaxID=3154463 RepID=UPI0033A486A0
MNYPPPRQPVDVESLLHRRSDLSTFLVHLTRNSAEADAREALFTILTNQRVRAVNAFGMAAELVKGTRFEDSQRAVCFTETPLEHAWMMCQPIADRSVQLSNYGVVFAKDWARRRGANPIWYIDITPGHAWLTHPINRLVEQAMAALTQPVTQPNGGVPDVLQLTPFIEQMGTGIRSNDGVIYRKEFSWEREWRHRGDLDFARGDVIMIFAPESDHTSFSQELSARGYDSERIPPILDPNWSLERMIITLAQSA